MKNTTIPILAALSAALPVSAQVTFDTIASGADFADPRINSRGDVAYISDTGGTTSAWRLLAGSSTPQLLAASGTTTSPFRGYGDFSSLADGADYRVVIETVRELDLGEDGNAAFITDFVIEPEGDEFEINQYNDSAIWVTGDGTIIDRTSPDEAPHVQCWLVSLENMRAYHFIENGEQVFGADGNDFRYDEFGAPVVGSDGQVTFNATGRDWRVVTPPDTFGNVFLNGTWIYRRPSAAEPFDPEIFMGRPPFLAVGGATAAGTTGTLVATTATPAPDAGDGIVSASLEGTSALEADGLWTGLGGVLTPVAIAGNSAPVSSGDYFQFGQPSNVASGNAAFWAELTSGETILIQRAGGIFAAALEGSQAPGFTGGETISSLGDPSMNSTGTAAFTAEVDGEPAVYVGSTPASLRLVARAGETAIGISGALFENFGAPRINALGQVAFPAKFRRADGSLAFGIWAMDTNGDMLHVAHEGDTLTGKTVAGITLSDFSNAGQLVLDTTFTDGSDALVRATIQPAAIENYAAWAEANIPDAANRAPLDDPDSDGIANLTEFASGSDPMDPDGENAPEIVLVQLPTGEPVIEATFKTLLPAAGVDFEIEVSADLDSWSNDVEVVSATLAGGGMQEIVAREIPGSDGNTGRCFLRITLSD